MTNYQTFSYPPQWRQIYCMNIILLQLRRGFNLRFLIVTLAATLLIFTSALKSILISLQLDDHFYHEYLNYLIVQALSSNTLSFFIPVLAGLPFSAMYLDDVRSKYVLFFLIRNSYRGYILGHCVACWLCGGSAVLLGALSAWGLTAIVFPSLAQITENLQEPGVQIAMQLTLLFLNGGLWAVVGMTMSTVMESKYIAYCSPFIVYYLLIILYERYFPNAWLIYPKNWLNPEIWPYGIGSAAMFLLELTFLCGLVFYVRGKRRLEQL